jgi:drug/metabolite transporter (DMT)-like permease
MFPTQLIGVISALGSAAVWGSGDFAGGVASRRNAPVFVLMLSSITGLAVLAGAALLLQDSLPTRSAVVWSALAGLSGGLGLTAFYRALATGPAAVVAPTSAVVGATVPVFVGFALKGLPEPVQVAALLLGLAGIGLVSSGADGGRTGSSDAFLLSVLAGLGFGGFFACIAQVERGSFFFPLAVTRVSELAVAAALYLVQKRRLPPQTLHPLPFAVGLLDAGGNVLYLTALQFIRLDIAAVIASMYPGATVLLAGTIQHERISRRQFLGIGLSLAAVGLIAVA